MKVASAFFIKFRDQIDRQRAQHPVDEGVLGPESSSGKLYWSTWHRTLGERAMHVLGAQGGIVEGTPGSGEYTLDELQRIFMFSRSETIYAGSSEIQRNIIGERVLGLPREPQVDRDIPFRDVRKAEAVRRFG